MSKVSFAVIVGARPNLIKVAPLIRELSKSFNIETTLIHTGQHYDRQMSDVFFEQLGIRRPDVSLGIGSGTHAVQTARIMESIESLLLERANDGDPFTRMVVVGDVNSTLAAALAAVKVHVPVAHIEAGLRSFDRSMPEEINRIVTDSISDQLFVTEPAGVANLLHEGHPANQIHLVGNLMIDTLVANLFQAKSLNIPGRLGLDPGAFGVVTLHRPSNVDSSQQLSRLVDALSEISERLRLVFPVHPRTQAKLAEFNLLEQLETSTRIILVPPQGYLELLSLVQAARLVVTDSGGLQEETTYLQVPCLTMRDSTERPITVEQGSSTLLGKDTSKLLEVTEQVLTETYKSCCCPELWDGHAAERIVEILISS